MSSPIFIDTGYILALVNTADRYHRQARDTALVMQERNLTHALTTDRDFEQAGFQNAMLSL